MGQLLTSHVTFELPSESWVPLWPLEFLMTLHIPHLTLGLPHTQFTFFIIFETTKLHFPKLWQNSTKYNKTQNVHICGNDNSMTVTWSSIVMCWYHALYYVSISLTFSGRYEIYRIFPSKASKYVVLEPNCTFFYNMISFICNLRGSTTYCITLSLVTSK